MKWHGSLATWLGILFLLLPLTFWGAVEVQGSPGNDPVVQLESSINEILSILQREELKPADKKAERRILVLAVINRMFDFRGMARSSLGPSWNDITPEERDRFVALFTDLVEQRYIGKIDSYGNQKVVYRDKRIKGDKARVYTALLDDNIEVPIDYSLEKNDGRWLVMDMRIENVSLVANYRRDFSSIIRKEQFAGLVERISEQLEKSASEN